MKDKISQLLELRRNNGIHAESKLTILAADFDMYVACVDERLIIKLGNRFDMGSLVPNPTAWKIIMTGPEFAIWENMKEHAILPQAKLTSDIVIDASTTHAGEATKTDVEIKITGDMSCGTVGRILEEVPGLVSNVKDLNEAMLHGCKVKPQPGKNNNKAQKQDQKKIEVEVEEDEEEEEDEEDEEEDDEDEEDKDDEEDTDEDDDDDGRKNKRK